MGNFLIHLRVNGRSGCSEERLTPATNQVAAVTCEGCKAWLEAEKQRILGEVAKVKEPKPLTPQEVGEFVHRLTLTAERGLLMLLLDRRFDRSERREDALAMEIERLTERMDSLANRTLREG